MIEIEKYLNEKYEFYINSFSNKPHFKVLGSDNDFVPLDDYSFNSLMRQLKNDKIKVNKDDLRTLVHSDFIQQRNPFIYFLDSIEDYDESVDYIDEISSSVKSNDNEYFKWAFKKWFVALIACVVNKKVANENVLIFIGGQGIGKTTWLKNLLPQELEDYYYSGEINPNNKDHLALFASKILINLDELTSFSQAKVDLFKEILSKNIVTFRRPYGTYNEDVPRIATMVGTSNYKDVLMDTTGNRRYLCIEVSELSRFDEVTLKKAYKQAFELYKQGFKHYFSKEEILKVNSSNTDFMQTTEENDIVTKYFEVCNPTDDDILFMNPTELIEYLRNNFKTSIKVNVTSLGRLLTSLGFASKKIHGIKKYALKLRTQKNTNNTSKSDLTEFERGDLEGFIDMEEYLSIEDIIEIDKQNYWPERIKDLQAEEAYYNSLTIEDIIAIDAKNHPPSVVKILMQQMDDEDCFEKRKKKKD